MNTVLIPPGPGGYGKDCGCPLAAAKVLSLTGREIHPVAIEIGALTESEIVNGFADIPPDNDILCVVINCAGSLRCGLYPQKGIPTINVLPTWRAGPLAHFITEDNYVSGVTMEQLVLVDTADVPESEPEAMPEPAPRVITTPPPARGAEKLVRMVEQTGTAVGHVIALLFAASREAVDVSLRNVIPFMAFVSLLIALVQETALGNLIAHALTPLANSLWGLVLLSLICGIPFLSPVLGPGAAISQVIGVMIGTQIGAGRYLRPSPCPRCLPSTCRSAATSCRRAYPCRRQSRRPLQRASPHFCCRDN